MQVEFMEKDKKGKIVLVMLEGVVLTNLFCRYVHM